MPTRRCPRLDRLHGAQAVVADQHDLAALDVTDVVGADEVERAHLPDATGQSSPMRPSTNGRKPSGSRKASSFPSASATHEYPAPSSLCIAFATASASGASSVASSAAISSLSDVEEARTPWAPKLLAELYGVHEVAVVTERDGARPTVVHDRLRVRPVRRARRRIARVPDRDLAAQAAQLLLVEHLRHEAHVAQRRHPTVVGDGDAGRLLPAVLEGEQAEVGDARNVASWCADAEDAAHQSSASQARRSSASS